MMKLIIKTHFSVIIIFYLNLLYLSMGIKADGDIQPSKTSSQCRDPSISKGSHSIRFNENDAIVTNLHSKNDEVEVISPIVSGNLLTEVPLPAIDQRSVTASIGEGTYDKGLVEKHIVFEYELIEKLLDLGVQDSFVPDSGMIASTEPLYLPIRGTSTDQKSQMKTIGYNHRYSIDENTIDRSSDGKEIQQSKTPSLHALLPSSEYSEDLDASSDGNLLGKGLQKLEKIKALFNSSRVGNGSYYTKDNIFHGGHGDVWRAFKLSSDGFVNHSITYILKRMNYKNNPSILDCVAREIYFGSYLMPFDMYVTKLLTHIIDEANYWLVFRDEGMSLHQLLYVLPSYSTSTMLQSSLIWKKIRTTSAGNQLLKGLIHHLIAATSQLHEQGVIHRDLKPNNILINTEREVKLIIGDFSSAVNEDILLKGGYGLKGPSIAEETLDYAPPEVLLSLDAEQIPYDPDYPESYDIWSIGVIFLEIILGTASVFSIDQRTASLMNRNIRKNRRKDHETENNERIMRLLAAWTDYCILDESNEDIDKVDDLLQSVTVNPFPQTDDYGKDEGVSFVPSVESLFKRSKASNQNTRRSCSKDSFARSILKRDPLGLGFHDVWGLDLLSRLLQFNPGRRIALNVALTHAYFHGPYTSQRDGTEFGLEEELHEYDEYIRLQSHQSSCIESICHEKTSNERKSLSNLLISPTSSRLTSSLGHLKSFLPMTQDNTTLDSKAVVDDIPGTQLPDDPVDNMIFTCPSCGRSFHGDYQACINHLHIRKHGFECSYDKSHLPDCLSEHGMLPIDPQSGWCDLQGRRRYIEDYHSIAFTDSYKYFGVFDGHYGNRAARSVSKRFHNLFETALMNEMERESSSDPVHGNGLT